MHFTHAVNIVDTLRSSKSLKTIVFAIGSSDCNQLNVKSEFKKYISSLLSLGRVGNTVYVQGIAATFDLGEGQLSNIQHINKKLRAKLLTRFIPPIATPLSHLTHIYPMGSNVLCVQLSQDTVDAAIT